MSDRIEQDLQESIRNGLVGITPHQMAGLFPDTTEGRIHAFGFHTTFADVLSATHEMAALVDEFAGWLEKNMPALLTLAETDDEPGPPPEGSR